MLDNFILNADSYKAGHFTFEPEGITNNYSYIEARKGGDFDEIVFFGLQDYAARYLANPISADDIDEAEDQIEAHGLPFNREGWEYILKRYGGYMPLHIRALPEGMVVPHSVPLVTVESTDDKCAWLASYIETSLQRGVWYPSTIASRSRRWKQKLLPLLQESGTSESIDFKIVDFGARGAECAEAAALGGAAHLVNFQVTDNQYGILLARRSYGGNKPGIYMPGFSIPATEHSVTTSWGQGNETDFFKAILSRYGAMPRMPDGSRRLVSVVIDTYDQDAAIKVWGTELKDELIASNMALVVRPDSGDPITNVPHVLNLLGTLFGFTVNERGYRVLPEYVRVIQGDGINEETLVRIAKQVNYHKWSLDNVNFGSGGGLLQKDVTRDTHRFAQKTSQVVVDGTPRDCQKIVKTDPSKQSKAGRFAVVRDKKTKKITTLPEHAVHNIFVDNVNLLQSVYHNGKIKRWMTFDQVRKNANV